MRLPELTAHFHMFSLRVISIRSSKSHPAKSSMDLALNEGGHDLNEYELEQKHVKAGSEFLQTRARVG